MKTACGENNSSDSSNTQQMKCERKHWKQLFQKKKSWNVYTLCDVFENRPCDRTTKRWTKLLLCTLFRSLSRPSSNGIYISGIWTWVVCATMLTMMLLVAFRKIRKKRTETKLKFTFAFAFRIHSVVFGGVADWLSDGRLPPASANTHTHFWFYHNKTRAQKSLSCFFLCYLWITVQIK